MNLKARAIEVGIKQGDIANSLRISDATVSAWLSRDRPIPSTYVRAIAQFLNVAVDALVPIVVCDACDNAPECRRQQRCALGNPLPAPETGDARRTHDAVKAA